MNCRGIAVRRTAMEERGEALQRHSSATRRQAKAKRRIAVKSNGNAKNSCEKKRPAVEWRRGDLTCNGNATTRKAVNCSGRAGIRLAMHRNSSDMRSAETAAEKQRWARRCKGKELQRSERRWNRKEERRGAEAKQRYAPLSDGIAIHGIAEAKPAWRSSGTALTGTAAEMQYWELKNTQKNTQDKTWRYNHENNQGSLGIHRRRVRRYA